MIAELQNEKLKAQKAFYNGFTTVIDWALKRNNYRPININLTFKNYLQSEKGQEKYANVRIGMSQREADAFDEEIKRKGTKHMEDMIARQKTKDITGITVIKEKDDANNKSAPREYIRKNNRIKQEKKVNYMDNKDKNIENTEDGKKEYKNNYEYLMRDVPYNVLNRAESYNSAEIFSKPLNDLSPLCLNFILNSEKHIMLFNSPTGTGKTYSFIKLIENLERYSNFNDENAIGQVYFLTDMVRNLLSTREDCSKFLDAAIDSKVLVLQNIEDTLVSSIKELEALENTIYGNGTKTYDNLFRYVRCYNDIIKRDKDVSKYSIEEDDQKEYKEYVKQKMYEAEREYRKEIRKLLESREELLGKSEREKAEIIENSEELKPILGVYKQILFTKAKYILTTVDKAFLSIDTIIGEPKNILKHQIGNVKNAVFFFDESDASQGKILGQIIKQNIGVQINIMDIIKSFYLLDDYNLDKLPVSDEDKDSILDEWETLKKEIDIYKNKYPINSPIKLVGTGEEKNHFMFIDEAQKVTTKRGDENLYFVFESNNIYIKNVEEISEEEIKEYISVKEFAQESNAIYIEMKQFIKKISNALAKENNETSLDNIREAIKLFICSDIDNDVLEKLATEIDLMSSKPYRKKEEEDFYYYPGVYASLNQEDASLGFSLNAYELGYTPESIIAKLCQKKAHIIFSSATAKNRSVFRNYNLEWEPLKNEIYEPSETERMRELEYIKKRDKYGDKVKYDIGIIGAADFEKEMSELKKYLVDELKIVKERDFEERIDELVIENDGNEYRKSQLIRILLATIDFIKKENKFAVLYSNFGVCNNKSFTKLVEDISKAASTNEREIFTEFVVAKSIKDGVNEIHKHISKNNTCLLFMPYSTGEKGLNLQYKSKNNDGVVQINDDRLSEYIDADGLYLGNVTYILDSSMDDDLCNKEFGKALSEIYHAFGIKKEISDYQYDKIMDAIMNPKNKNEKMTNSVFNRIDIKTTNAYCHKLGATLMQTIGRIFRTNRRYNKCTINIDYELYEKCREIGKINNAFDEDTIEKMQYGMREIMNFIFSKKLRNTSAITDGNGIADYIINGQQAVVKSMSEDEIIKQAVTQTKISAKKHDKLLSNKANDNYSYKKMREVYVFAMTEKEYMKDEERNKNKYIKLPFKDKDGYLFNRINTQYETMFADDIAPLNSKKYKDEISVKKLGFDKLTDYHLRILKKYGIEKFAGNIDEAEKDGFVYAVNPMAFSILKGNIGEALASEWIKNGSNERLVGFTDESYEVLDFYLQNVTKNLICFDAKFFNDKAVANTFDDKETKKRYFENKIKKIQNDKNFESVEKIICVVVNANVTTRRNKKANIVEDNDKYSIITVQNIYHENGKFNYDVYKDLERKINKVKVKE